MQAYFGEQSIFTPAGECPVALKSTEAEAVYAWADKVRAYHEKLGQRIAPQGVLYYSRYFFAYGTPEYRDIRAILLGDEPDPEIPHRKPEVRKPEPRKPDAQPSVPRESVAQPPKELLDAFVDRLVAGEPRRRLAAELQGMGFPIPVTRLYNLGVARKLQLGGDAA